MWAVIGTVDVMERIYASASDLTTAMRAGEVSSLELTEEAIARIGEVDGDINSICVPDFERAREAAREADSRRASGDDGPLLGLPVTVKESFNVAGLPTTWGMPQFRDFVPPEDAVAVQRLKSAGAVVLGKTNVPLMLGDLQSFNDIYGTTNNPWDLGRTPGGSSGGSAAALASGIGSLSIGSDIGGSLRTPAHFCGIYAHKPTFGVAANRGHVPPPAPALPSGRDLAVVGPMARTARDLSLLFDVMAGPDPLTEGIAYQLELPPARHEQISDYRVLVLDDHPLIPTGNAVRAAVARVADVLSDAGAQVQTSSALLPDLEQMATLYVEFLLATLAAGYPDEVYAQMQAAASAMDMTSGDFATAGLRGATFTHRDWVRAADQRESVRAQWRQLFGEFDVVVCPVTPTPAFPHDPADMQSRTLDVDGTDYPAAAQVVWAGLVTMPGLPATAIPAAGAEDPLPVGVQLVGPMFEDRTPLRLAELLEDVMGGFRKPDQFA